MQDLKVCTWNLHKCSRIRKKQQFVIDYLEMQQDADIFVLVEYTDDKSITDMLEQSNYWYRISQTVAGNYVLIAVKKLVFDEIRPDDIITPKGVDKCYDLLHVRLHNEENDLNIIGVRFLSGNGAVKGEAKAAPLVDLLNSLESPYICTGDFNLTCSTMKAWFKRSKQAEVDGFSWILQRQSVIDSYTAIDHLLYSDNIKVISAFYDWQFIEKAPEIYPKQFKLGCPWKTIPFGCPDHAMLVAELQLEGAMQ